MSTQKAKFELFARLQCLGFTYDEAAALRRIEMTLQRWAERECGDGSNWAIERDETTGKPFNVYHGEGKPSRYAIADREAGALKRLKAICDARNARNPSGFVMPYHQGDCRGCMVYIVPSEVLEGDEIVNSAKAAGFRFDLHERAHDGKPSTYTVPGLAGNLFTFPEQGAVAFLKAKGLPVPASRNLPIDQFYTRGVAVCA